MLNVGLGAGVEGVLCSVGLHASEVEQFSSVEGSSGLHWGRRGVESTEDAVDVCLRLFFLALAHRLVQVYLAKGFVDLGGGGLRFNGRVHAKRVVFEHHVVLKLRHLGHWLLILRLLLLLLHLRLLLLLLGRLLHRLRLSWVVGEVDAAAGSGGRLDVFSHLEQVLELLYVVLVVLLLHIHVDVISELINIALPRLSGGTRAAERIGSGLVIGAVVVGVLVVHACHVVHVHGVEAHAHAH